MTINFDTNDPLFRALRSKVLWHCTSVDNFRAIASEGVIRPVAGTTNRWGHRPYACQTLQAVCLFDFATPTQDEVLVTADRWSPFIVGSSPVTVIVGLARERLPGRLVPYPENRDISPQDSCGPIQYVEVCHVGEIPVTAAETYLLVCSENHRCFKQVKEITPEVLEEVVPEYEGIVRQADETRVLDIRRINARIKELKARRTG